MIKRGHVCVGTGIQNNAELEFTLDPLDLHAARRRGLEAQIEEKKEDAATKAIAEQALQDLDKTISRLLMPAIVLALPRQLPAMTDGATEELTLPQQTATLFLSTPPPSSLTSRVLPDTHPQPPGGAST